MLSSATPNAFLAVVDLRRARSFYSDILGLQLLSEDPSALVYRFGAGTLRVNRVPEAPGLPYTVLGWTVPDVGPVCDALQQKSVVLERFPGMDQDSRGVWRAPGGARVAWFGTRTETSCR